MRYGMLPTRQSISYLTEILEKAKVEQRVKPKLDNQNQKRFSEMILMKNSKYMTKNFRLTVEIFRDNAI